MEEGASIKNKKFHHVGVHLPVNNLQETLNFYKNVIGFYDEWTEGAIDGGIRRDSLRLLFGENPEHVRKINDGTHALNLLWFVDNIEEIYREFQERGIEISSPLLAYTYGLKEFAFIDINGYYIRIAESF